MGDRSLRKEAEKTLLSVMPGRILFDEPLAGYTSFRIGGPADILAMPGGTEELQAVLQWADERSVPVSVLGAGTNLLVSDKGVRGLVIRLQPGFAGVEISGSVLRAGAVARISALVRKSLGRGLAGLEGLSGIPGTVGGAICMNAGTPAGCIGDVLTCVQGVDLKGNTHCLSRDDLGLAYRNSSVKRQGMVVIQAEFALRPQSKEKIEEIVRSLQTRRRSTQPVRAWTAGSVFKNPPGGFAGEILERLGAKGIQMGGARVSSKHANFIENTGAASAEDVRSLMLLLQEMAETAGFLLEPEIELVGEW